MRWRKFYLIRYNRIQRSWSVLSCYRPLKTTYFWTTNRLDININSNLNSNDWQNTSISSVRSSNTFSKNINKHSITSAKWGQLLAISWLLYTNLQNKTHCVGFFARTYKTEHTTDRSLLWRHHKKVNISLFF